MIRPQPASHPGRGRRRGTAAVQMAFVLPVLLVLIVGTMDVAQLVYANDTVAEAGRTGARYAMVHGSMASSPVGPSANNATVTTVVKNNALALDTSRLTVTSSWPNGSNAASNPVTVTASYQCKLFVGTFLRLNDVTVQSSTTMLITH